MADSTQATVSPVTDNKPLPTSPSELPPEKPMNGLPSIADIAQQFKGKSMYAASLTKPDPQSDAPADVDVQPVTESTETVNTDPANDQPVPESTPDPVQDTPDVPKEPPVAEDPVAQRFAKLTQREKQQRERDQQFQQREQQLLARMQDMQNQLDAKQKELADREQRLKGAKRPLDVLQAAGFTYEEATRDAIGGYTPKPADPVDEKLKPLYEKLEKLDAVESRLAAREQELEQAKNQNNLQVVNGAIRDVLGSDPDKYEYVSKMGEEGLDLVRETMVQYYQSHKSMMTYEQACDQVESYYADEVVSKLLGTKKAQAAKKPVEPQTKPQTKPQESAVSQQKPKTITSAMGQSGSQQPDFDKLPKREALAQLAKQLKFV